MGPEGGSGGGKVVASGNVNDIIKANTWTGKYLRRLVEG